MRVSGCIVCLDSGDFGYWCLVFRGVLVFFSFYLFFLFILIITLYYYLFSLPNHYLFRFALLSYLCVDLQFCRTPATYKLAGRVFNSNVERGREREREQIKIKSNDKNK